MKKLTINISDEFSNTPGPRYRIEGNFSGEQFREEVLMPAFTEAEEKDLRIIINLDGAAGYGTSFLEEVFGGLARTKGVDEVLRKIEIVSEEEPYLKEDIEAYIKDAQKEFI